MSTIIRGSDNFNTNDVVTQTQMDAKTKIVDFGTVVNNNRYVLPNPFGNANFEGCIARAEIYHNGIWSGTGWVDHSDMVTKGYGVTGFSNLEGIVVQTGQTALMYEDSVNQGNGFGLTTTTPITSAPCRVIITYIGDAT